MTDLTDNNKDKPVSDNVAVAEDVAVPAKVTTPGPNKTRANVTTKTNGKPSGKVHKPSRVESDKHWRSKTNREQTRQII